MELGDIEVNQRIVGLSPSGAVTIQAVNPRGGNAVEVTFRASDGTYGGQILYAPDAGRLRPVESRRRFDADTDEFRLASEARRILDAAKYDKFLSVSTSDVRPLPHQLKAVYEEMLPRVPLRFLLADDPGAGKTIMAGLYIKQLVLRDDVRRCLVVVPGGLVEQWQDELGEKFGLEFDILTNDRIQATRDGSVFDHHPFLIARMDQLSRNEELLAQVSESQWDLVVVDEAHRMSAHIFGNETKKSLRFQLGEILRDRTRHFLLMTATPHAGKEEDFQLFLSLLDPDTFEGRAREGVVKLDPRSFMRRAVKEDLVTFDGKPLFPKRVATTVEYELSEREQELYERVSDYVRTEMNRADKLDGKRRNTVGFALTILQRRLASSPEAIYRSLERRGARLRKRRDDIKHGILVEDALPEAPDDDEDFFPSSDYEDTVDQVTDSATGARTVEELEAELVALDELTDLARRLRASGDDVKWGELSRIIRSDVLGQGGRRRKLIVFTEHRDTLEYLRQRIGALTGHDTVLAIHGGVNRKERRRVTAEFTHNEDAQFLIATDAAGEGLNLQAAHLMVNYDLPWNPNRIEQRFGRVHRIGQQDTCQLWNLVATNTREGDVYVTLLRKLEEMSRAYEGKVFDVLGEAFTDGTSLRDLMVEAIRYGDDPDVRARMQETVNAQAGDGVRELIEQHDLEHDRLTSADVEEMRLQMEEAYARRLAPHFIFDAFSEAYTRLGGRWSRISDLTYRIGHVPQRFRKHQKAIATSYERATFDPNELEGPDGTRAALLTPGHPLHDEVLQQALDEFGDSLERGSVFTSDSVSEPHLLVGVAQEVVDGLDEVIDRRFAHVLVNEDGEVSTAGLTPHLDLEPHPEGAARVDEMPWLGDAERRALDFVVEEALPKQLAELRPAREQRMDRLWDAVYSRLTHEINRLGERGAVAHGKETLGLTVRHSSASLFARAEELKQRREERKQLIDAQRRLGAKAPRLVSFALVLPKPHAPEAQVVDTTFSERRAVEKVLGIERSLGREPHEQARNNEGFDVLSLVPGEDRAVIIEVKGRIKGATDFVITRSEVITARNKGDDYRLALVAVDPDDPSRDEVVYVPRPFDDVSFGGFSTGKLVLPWRETWDKGKEPW